MLRDSHCLHFAKIGMSWLQDVRVAKTFILETSSEIESSKLDELCKSYLSNPVSQRFSWRPLTEDNSKK